MYLQSIFIFSLAVLAEAKKRKSIDKAASTRQIDSTKQFDSTAIVQAAPAAPADPTQPGAGLVGAIQDANNYCTWLPRIKGTTVALGEDDALPFCSSTNIQGTNGTQSLPSGLILSANYAEGTGYKQVSGCMAPQVYGFDPLTDGGGQYDILAPAGASMAGCSNFVNLVEPENFRWCIRCCQAGYEEQCDISVSTYGCVRVVPGDYAYGPNKAACTEQSAIVSNPIQADQNITLTSNSTSFSSNGSSSSSSSTSTLIPSNVPTTSSASKGQNILSIASILIPGMYFIIS